MNIPRYYKPVILSYTNIQRSNTHEREEINIRYPRDKFRTSGQSFMLSETGRRYVRSTFSMSIGGTRAHRGYTPASILCGIFHRLISASVLITHARVSCERIRSVA